MQHAIGSSDEMTDFCGAVVGRDLLTLVSQQVLAVLQANTRRPKAPPKGVAQVMNADALETVRRCDAKALLVTL